MEFRPVCKVTIFSIFIFLLVGLTSCTVNPLTGRQEFTGLMSPQEEQSIGASQHRSIIREYGGVYPDKAVQAYVTEIGEKLARQSDRQDVHYTFTVLDSPIVNAFALPGGYIYITRGTLALANSEAELAAVLGHEIGHVAGRHQAARYSQGVLTQLGATVLSSAIGVPAASQAIGLGSELYMSSYSRAQESEADKFGVRYLDRAGYDLNAMSDFLKNMSAYHAVQARVEGKPQEQFSYFSSHPDSDGRAVDARIDAGKYQRGQDVKNRERYLSMIRGLSYGEDAKQGFVRDGHFYHPEIGFAFSFPPSFRVDNKPQRVAIEGRDGTVLVLDMANAKGLPARDYLASVWLKGRGKSPVEDMDVNGLQAATSSVPVNINNQAAEVRLVAIEWGKKEVVRMQILIPNGASPDAVDDMKRISYSFQKMTNRDRHLAKPYRIDLVRAGAGDTAQSLAQQMGVEKMPVEQFLAINGLQSGEPLIQGQMYKIIQ